MEEILQQILNGQQQIQKELTDLKTGQTQVQQEVMTFKQETSTTLSRLETTLTQTQKNVQKTNLTLENSISPKIDFIYEAREVQSDVNERICKGLTRIESKLERISLKITANESDLKRIK